MTEPKIDPDADGVAAFAYEMGALKRIRRSGWWHVGIRDPESVAEHSLRVAQLASLIASVEGADPSRAAFMGMWHDSQETRIGDIPHSARPYVDGRVKRVDHRRPSCDPPRRGRQGDPGSRR